MKNKENKKTYTLEEVSSHNSELDCWTVVNGKVYNITPFIKMHPGGDKIHKAFGINATEIFSKLLVRLFLFRRKP